MDRFTEQLNRYRPWLILTMFVVGVLLVVGSCRERVELIEEEEALRYSLNDTLRNCYSDHPATQRMERSIRTWMARNNIRGASLAIMRDERLIYCKGFGWADKEIEREAEAGDIYRIASASKLITAIGIMKLVDEGKLSVDDTVFGEEGILNEFTEYRDKRVPKITVHHLLNHTSGFSRSTGDPMFRSVDVMRWMGLHSTLSSDDVIRYQLGLKLRDKPGGSGQYSNVGYMVLSKIIERVSGMSYEEYLQTHVLRPAGCYDMHIARNYYEERFAHEVKYYGHDPGEVIESYDGTGAMRPREYGGNNITGLQGAGAWVASSAELMRLVASIDGKPGVPDILSEASIRQMRHIDRKGESYYGWALREGSKWIRTGTMSGTCAYISSQNQGLSFVLLTNTSSYRGATFTKRIGRTIENAFVRVKEWPIEHDLFVAVPQSDTLSGADPQQHHTH